eukprot:309410-Chlamydomonas_euryale.AAC.1
MAASCGWVAASCSWLAAVLFLFYRDNWVGGRGVGVCVEGGGSAAAKPPGHMFCPQRQCAAARRRLCCMRSAAGVGHPVARAHVWKIVKPTLVMPACTPSPFAHTTPQGVGHPAARARARRALQASRHARDDRRRRACVHAAGCVLQRADGRLRIPHPRPTLHRRCVCCAHASKQHTPAV